MWFGGGPLRGRGCGPGRTSRPGRPEICGCYISNQSIDQVDCNGNPAVKKRVLTVDWLTESLNRSLHYELLRTSARGAVQL